MSSDLAWTCAELGQEVRDRQWRALEQFGEAYAAGQRTTAEQLLANLSARLATPLPAGQ